MYWTRNRAFWLLFTLAGLCVSCPEAEEAEDQGNDVEEDAAADPEPDPDLPPEVADQQDLDLQVEDIREIDLVGDCTPFSIGCSADFSGIRRCSYDGAWLNPSPCGTGEVCEETATGAHCVACEPGVNCRDDEPICDPGEPFCYNFETAANCTEQGRLDETETMQCRGRCFGGGCHNVGTATGTVCTENEGCQGRMCICGTEDAENTSTALCDGNLAGGYCTTSSCDVNGCDPATEVCADFTLPGAFGDDNYCLLKSNCSHRLYDCAANHRGTNHVCREVPSSNWNGTRRTWALACWVPPPATAGGTCADANCLSPIGGACLTNTDCIGGLCLTNDESVTYCAAPCDVTHECPSYSSCVRIPDLSDNYYCLANANTTDCPRMGGFDIISRNFSSIDGVTTAQVCFYTY